MKNKDLILMLIDKSVNAFGELIGLTEDAKLNVALSIIQDTIKNVFNINSNILTPNNIDDILVKGQLDCDQIHLLANLLWTKAEILSKLDRQITSLTNYENTLLLLRWRIQQTVEKNQLEKQSKITELKAIIETLKPTKHNEKLNKYIVYDTNNSKVKLFTKNELSIMKKQIIILAAVILQCVIYNPQSAICQNVGINTTGAAPNASSLLDIDVAPGNSKGFLIPRVNLAQRTGVNFNPLPAPAQGLLIYQTDAGDFGEGFYYNTSTTNTPAWVKLSAGTSGWSLTGNAGTSPNTSFLGTTDNKSLRFRTNNIQNMIIDSLYGSVGMGNTNPQQYLQGTIGLSIYHINYPGLSLANNSGKFWLNYMPGNGDLRLYQGGPGFGDRVTFQDGGNVGIGTISPGAKLTINQSATTANLLDIQSNGTSVLTMEPRPQSGILSGSPPPNYNGSMLHQQLTNLAYNGGFEVWGNGVSSLPSGWDDPGSVSFAQDATFVKEGKYSMKLTWVSFYPQVGRSVPSALVSGKILSMSVWVYDPDGTSAANPQISVDCYDGGGCADYSRSQHSDITGWELLTVSLAISPTTTAVRYRVIVQGTGSAYFDAVMVTAGNGPLFPLYADKPLLDAGAINVLSTGNVGVGTTTAPAYRLDVCGDIRATGSVYYGGTCGTANGTLYTKPDYVFAPDYKLNTPAEVEQFIDQKGHLPWLTSANIEKKENNGAVNITRMSFETLEAVENMQLQIIELAKQNKVQQKLIKEMKEEVELLKKK